jgi:NADH-quinone oxidoreductase subunit L
MESLEVIRNIQMFPWGFLWLIPGAPLLGAILNGAVALGAARGGKNAPKAFFSTVALTATFLSFWTTTQAWNALKELPEGSVLTQDLATWIEAGNLHARFGLEMDALSLVMAFFVTFVGFLIHLYSVGYMGHDKGYGRYFSYLNLFMAAMLVLVLADNLLFLFVGWEGVGLCSFLLISFWFEDKAKAEAGKKAFLTNRVGDAGFLLGTFLVLAVTGSLNFQEIQSQRHLLTTGAATLAALLFFAGAAGKSAQIPLYIWLPDAMAGPTPVSALIHAATMVTAGVYLVARLHFLFAVAPAACIVVAVTGALTALLAATIAVAQNDIKKVLAYSTISQLGFMFVGVGVASYTSGIFHVMTHSFFKACLFLGAGSVIHAMHGEQDIRKMGGLLKHMPITGITFILAAASISGFPGFAGFFSKDEILWKALATPNALVPWLPMALYGVLVFSAFLTAFYMTRLAVMTFGGEFRGGHEAQEKLRESPKVMTIPLVILALGSIVAGGVNLPKSIGGEFELEKFLDPIFHGSMPDPDPLLGHLETMFLFVSALVALLGIGLGLAVYLRKKTFVIDETQRRLPGLRDVLVNKYWVDELVDRTVLAAVRFTARWVSAWLIDAQIIERVVSFLAGGVTAVGRSLRRLQTGLVRWTVAGMALGAAVLLYWVAR